MLEFIADSGPPPSFSALLQTFRHMFTSDSGMEAHGFIHARAYRKKRILDRWFHTSALDLIHGRGGAVARFSDDRSMPAVFTASLCLQRIGMAVVFSICQPGIFGSTIYDAELAKNRVRPPLSWIVFTTDHGGRHIGWSRPAPSHDGNS